MNIIERDQKEIQFVNILRNFGGHLSTMHTLLDINKREMAASYLAMAHSDYNSLKNIYCNLLPVSEEIDSMFGEYQKYKQEIDNILLKDVKENISWLIVFHKDLMNRIFELEDYLMK